MGEPRAYYNEWDPYAAAWLRNLVAARLLPSGDVDERSIADVQPGDLAGYTQCHFFAGIGGWAYAARLAGWPDERPLWTGSCPCQPFSHAGRGGGFNDPRHLWPEWFRLIRKCCPSVVFGEQADKAARLGWLDLVADDLEDEGYAVAPIVLPACAAGAPHRRHRIWFVADSERRGLQGGVLERPDQGAVQLAADRCGRFGYPIGPAWDGEPDLAVLVHGLPADVAATRAYGNAIVPQVAAEVIGAWMDVTALSTPAEGEV